MEWSSYIWGLATIPALIFLFCLALGVIALLERTPVGTKCDQCSWDFAGRREIFERRDCDDTPTRPAPMNVVAFFSGLWHDQIIMRTTEHRQAWTTDFEALKRGSALREKRLRWAKRNGLKWHDHRA